MWKSALPRVGKQAASRKTCPLLSRPVLLLDTMRTAFVIRAAAVSISGTLDVHAVVLLTIAAVILPKIGELKIIATAPVCQHGTLLDTKVSMMPGVILIMENAAPILSNGARVSVQNVDGQRFGAALPASLAIVGRRMTSTVRRCSHSSLKSMVAPPGRTLHWPA